MSEIKVLDEKVLNNRKVILQTIKQTLEKGKEITRSNLVVPHLTDEQLLERYNNIKPIIYNNAYYTLTGCNIYELRQLSYISPVNFHTFKKNPVELTEAEVVAEFPCYHSYRYQSIFNPSIAEILEQFHDEALNTANAFYMIDSPEDKYGDSIQAEIELAGYHESTIQALVLKK